jgi:hypothetical protein
MTTLTDRYVWGVLRAVPEGQRAELEPEIRALVADAVDARVAAGTNDATEAERAALIELGDPDDLAARYTGRSRYLIGPKLFQAWRRVLVPVLLVVVPIVAVVSLVGSLLGDRTVGESIVAGMSSGYMVAVMITFWMTLVFALLEWTGTADTVPEFTWTPDKLPDVPSTERLGAAELIASTTANVLVAAFIIWQQASAPIVVDGTGQPILDPALWSFWLPYFLVVTLAEIVFTIALYRRGGWTYPFAVGNAILGAAFAIPALWLLQNGLLFNPAIIDALDDATGGAWLAPTAIIIGVTVLVIVIWDAAEGFWKAYRNTRVEGRQAEA